LNYPVVHDGVKEQPVYGFSQNFNIPPSLVFKRSVTNKVNAVGVIPVSRDLNTKSGETFEF
jgi:hypothetical protein